MLHSRSILSRMTLLALNLLALNLLAALFSAGARPSQAAEVVESCTDLARPGLFPNTAIESAVLVAADARTGLPSYCELRIFLATSPTSVIGAVYRLPENWNGRMLGLGGGGWTGHTILRSPFPILGPGRFADLGLTRGYATAQTDAGHRMSPFSADVSWMRDNPEAITDFSHRGIHEMTVLGKQVVAAYYGRAATKNYYQGCSTGGRMGLMEAQRYPDDYDGVVAGAPVYDLLTQTGAMVRDQIFKAPGAAMSDEQLKLVSDAVLSACDAEDGLKDGVLTDPRRCNWEPKSLQCTAGDETAGTCLAPAQVEALDKAYRTVRTSTGLVGNYGLTRGSEIGWRPNLLTVAGPRNVLNGGVEGLTELMFGSSTFDPATFDIETQQAAVHQTPFAAEYEASSVDLSEFVGRGGKLLLWHGLDDSGPSAFGTADYYERALQANGGDNLRFFALPGVYHCSAGPGAHTFDPLTALEQWVENDIEPSMVATNSSGGERPVCAWPTLPYYESGDPARATSFVCR